MLRWDEMPLAFATTCSQGNAAKETPKFPCLEPRTVLGIPMIPWGLNLTCRPQYVFKDTCPLDNTMMILSFLYEHDSSFRSFLHMRDMKEKAYIQNCLKLIREHKFNLARRLWMESMLKRKALQVPYVNDFCGSEFHVAPLSTLFGGYYERRKCFVHGESYVSRSPLNVSCETVVETVSYLNGGFSDTYVFNSKTFEVVLFLSSEALLSTIQQVQIYGLQSTTVA